PSIATEFIAAFAINPFNGALIALPGRYLLASSGVTLIIDPSNRFLFAVAANDLNVFAIDPFTGALTPTAGSPFPLLQGSMRGAVMDPSGRFFYGTDRAS